MTDRLMIELRRSPRKLLERDGHPGPGPGKLALVLARAGIGKTAFLVGVGIDALLAGQKVLHVSLESTVEKVRDWHDEVLMEMLRREKKLSHWAAIQIEVERRRHIHTYMGGSFSVDRLRNALDLLKDVMNFVPQVILLDDIDVEGEEIDASTIAAIKNLAAEAGSELWMTAQTHREDPQPEPGQLPSPASALGDLTDLAFRLDSHDAKVRLHVLMDHQKIINEDLHILLDPQTLLLTVGLGSGT